MTSDARRRSGRHGRGDLGRALRGEVGLRLVGDQLLRSGDGVALGARGQAGLQRDEVDDGDAGQGGDRGVDVAGQPEVAHGQRPAVAGDHGGGHRLEGDHRADRAPVQATSTSAAASSSARSSNGAERAGVPVRRVFSTSRSARSAERLSDDLAGPGPAQVGRGERAHRAGTDHHRPDAREVAVQRLGGGGEASETIEAPAASIPVRVCTRLPTRSACCDSSCSVRPTDPPAASAAA